MSGFKESPFPLRVPRIEYLYLDSTVHTPKGHICVSANDGFDRLLVMSLSWTMIKSSNVDQIVTGKYTVPEMIGITKTHHLEQKRYIVRTSAHFLKSFHERILKMIPPITSSCNVYIPPAGLIHQTTNPHH